ncbi:hypothetical protein [Methylobacillus sp. Pita1]
MPQDRHELQAHPLVFRIARIAHLEQFMLQVAGVRQVGNAPGFGLANQR